MRRMLVVGLLLGVLAPSARAAACPPVRVVAARGGVWVHRDGRTFRRVRTVRPGDRVELGRRAHLVLGRGRGRLGLGQGASALGCRGPRPLLRLGSGHARAVRVAIDVATREALARGAGATWTALRVPRRGRTFAHVERGLVRLAAPRIRNSTLRAHPEQFVVAARGVPPRRDTDPFPRSPRQRGVRRADRLPWIFGGGGCASGCRPRARAGWPLRPFHRQHALRSGLNEHRPRSMHVGIDIQSGDRIPVYALQSGRARLLGGGVDRRVRVGAFEYWHLRGRVRDGTQVRAYRTVLGRIIPGFKHVHLSELRGDTYLNPLRPGGRVLGPWRDTEPPVIGSPRIDRRGRGIVQIYDPQSFAERRPYHTPVLAAAGVAWRLGRGRLHFAYRGAHHLDWSLHRAIWSPGAHEPGFTCFNTRVVCLPRWWHVLAGGLAPPIRGRGTLHVYAWDWAGNVSARDFRR